MKLQLNPTFETFILLSGSTWGKKQKKEAIKQLDDLGINGAAFYAANFPVVERYFAAFASQMVESPGNAMFEDMCDELEILLVAVLLLHPEWLSDFDAVSDEEASAAVHEVVADFLQSDNEPIEALAASELSDHTKWQIAALLQQPTQKLSLITEAVNANLPAFEYASAKAEADIAPLFTQLQEQLDKGELPPAIDTVWTLNPDAHMVPSLAACLMILVFGEYCFVGLLSSKLFSGQGENLTEDEAALVAKSLSDASKLKILRVLKNAKLYNLEIARAVGLTPATTSHHMNMLLAAGLVEISKGDGKVYYGLCAEGIKRYCTWLSDSLL